MNENEIKQLLNNVIGKKSKNVKKIGNGSFFLIDFGKDIEYEVKTNREITKNIRGEWQFWIYMCAWRIDKDNIPIVGCEDEDISERIKIIDNKELKDISILSKSYDMVLKFEQNIELFLFTIITNDAEQWRLFTPDRQVFIAGPGVDNHCEPSGE